MKRRVVFLINHHDLIFVGERGDGSDSRLRLVIVNR
jgi:hypothetical protein